MGMITRRQFETLVERVVSRIVEDVPPSVTKAKTGNFRYNASGETVEEPDEVVNATAKTQMPPTMHPPTVPAAKSSTQQQADAELSQMNAKSPNAKSPSQKQIKVNAIKKSLDMLGYTHTPEGQKNATQNLGAWYDKLDPADALVATADELAQRFSNGD